ncbi:MAG: hypothetical protein PHS62_04070 [Patescibacteria group bacterium]|nr:hypothetical protein [Patescibacteria group bacterium]
MEQGIESVQNNQEQVNQSFEKAKKSLKLIYGIDKLSINEQFILRKAVEDVLRRYEREVKPILERNDENNDSDGMFNDGIEIRHRFFLDAYGIYLSDFPRDENHRITEDFKQYLQNLREKSHLI